MTICDKQKSLQAYAEGGAIVRTAFDQIPLTKLGKFFSTVEIHSIKNFEKHTFYSSQLGMSKYYRILLFNI